MVGNKNLSGRLEGTLYTQNFIFYSREQGTGNREQETEVKVLLCMVFG
ncbi:hypothetical protein [Dolichospermum circinale]|nr:hypothetical protein [Dolichospermum circinale]